MTYTEYIDLINTEYFSICNNKSVLEIGPSNGYLSDLIVKQHPIKFTTVEPNLRHVQKLKLRFPEESVVHNDILFYLERIRPFDVVICFGLLYHLHSSLHLLEVIVNRCNPEYILLDCTNSHDTVKFETEYDNAKNYRQLLHNWKSAGLSLVPPFKIIEQAMSNLGYTQVRTDILLVEEECISKRNSWVGIWKKSIL